MVRQLRQGKGRHGLILANGGILTYQHALCLSTAPREDGSYPDNREDPRLVATERGPPVSAIADGEAAIEVCDPHCCHYCNLGKIIIIIT